MRRSFFKTFTAVAVAAAAVGIATPASAYSFPQCDVTLMNPDAQDCTGYFSGNLINGSSTDIAKQQQAIADLDGDFVWDGNWNDPDLIKLNAEDGDSPIDFGITLFGETIIGVHWGNVPGAPQTKGQGNVSAFYLFDFGTEGGTITLADTRGWSNAVLYTTGSPPPPQVPEPATWAMMLLGFGATGFAMRRGRKTETLPQIA
jgi:hypothetical protein